MSPKQSPGFTDEALETAVSANYITQRFHLSIRPQLRTLNMICIRDSTLEEPRSTRAYVGERGRC